MAGWENSDDIQVESVEEIIDTNCDVYIKRMEYCIEQLDFQSAYMECEHYLSLGGSHGIYELMKQCIKDVQDGKLSVDYKIDRIKLNVHVIQGESLEFYVDRADASVNELKDMLMGTVKYIGDVIGMTGLYNELVAIYTSNRGVIKTAQTIDEAVKDTIAILEDVDPDDKLGKVAALKQIVYDGDNEEEYTQSIFMSTAKTIVWITKKVARKLRDWFGVEAEENILRQIGANIANCFRAISNWHTNVGKASGSMISYAVGAAMTACDRFMYSNLDIHAIADALHKSGKWEEIHLRKVDDESDLHMGKELL